MAHCDADALALVALGERPSAADADHLRDCELCRAEIDSFGRVVAAARPPIPAGPDVPPAPQVWDAVAAATGVGVRPRTADTTPLPTFPVPVRTDRGAGVDRDDRSAADDHDHDGGGTLSRLRPRPSRRGRTAWWPMAAVAASALLLGGALGVVGSRLLAGDDTPVAQVVARTTLDPLPADPKASGTAVVVDAAGTRRLEVDVSDLSRTDGFYEVWLIDAAVKKMVPIGVLTGTRGEFTIPADLDLGAFPVVDISAEPLDGDPTHSGKSHLRGVIQG